MMFETDYDIKHVDGLCSSCMTWYGPRKFAVRFHYPRDVNGNPFERTYRVIIHGRDGREERLAIKLVPDNANSTA
ncbi:MAG: hypothetical protein D6790_15070 [Caldilineae bacterium]|nr:MAG: hypothetical protein D6790_15070 [Caldilineae bacterium]